MQRYRGRGGGFAPRRGVGRGRMQEETQTDDEEEVTVENLHIDEVVPLLRPEIPAASGFSGDPSGIMSPQNVTILRPLSLHELGLGHEPRNVMRGLCHSPGGVLPVTPAMKEINTKGHSGREIDLVTNYFRVLRGHDWGLHQYFVEFNPQEDQTFVRKAILRRNKDLIGHRYIFDGTLLHTPFLLDDIDASGRVVINAVGKDDTQTVVTLRYIKSTEYGDPIYIQFYNLIVRKCMFGMGLEEVGRGFFDAEKCIDFPSLSIQLWPGFLTSIQNHDLDVLLCVEITHKVLRTESAMDILLSMRASYRGPSFEEHANSTFANAIVMTTYNHATYRIKSIDFNANPTNTFKNKKGEDVSYQDYYQNKYQKQITSLGQPLFITVSTIRPPKNVEAQVVALIPELCIFTGLSDTMRANNSLMRELSTHLHMVPTKRVQAIQGFMQRLMETQELLVELEEWGLRFQTNMITVPGRVLPPEPILFASGTEIPNNNEDWTKAFRTQKLFRPESINKWVLVATQKDSQNAANLVRTMQKVATPLGFNIRQPEMIIISDPKAQCYMKAIDDLYPRIKELQMVFVVLSSTSAHIYGSIKKRLVVDFGASSQCFLTKNLTSKGIMSIATKVVIQMTAKIGGEPWTVKVPIKNLMVVGLDSYNDTYSVVASLSKDFTKYFSAVGTKNSNGNIFCSDMEKCLTAYRKLNKELPARVVIYRVGNITHDSGRDETEAREIKAMMKEMYEQASTDPPTLTYLIVCKRINTRMFAENGNGGFDNPPPGTIVDDTITLKDKYQFFMISSTARQGTVAPCSYIVIYDDSNLQADKLQYLTYKLCHMYFNWSGTVSVPAHVQYAHKLAQMTSVAYGGGQPSKDLSNNLFYL